MATLEQIQRRIDALRKQAEAVTAKITRAALDEIRLLMERHGLTTKDIDAYRPRGRPGKGRQSSKASASLSSAAAKKGKLPPKYRNPDTGETWSGHARPPAWIKDVKDRSKFLIDKAASVPGRKKGVSAKVAAKKTKRAARKTAR